MTSLEEARRRVSELAVPRSVEPVLPKAALGRVLADDVLATHDLPRFDSSAVDGYAVAGPDLDTGADFVIVASVRAGDTGPLPRLLNGEAAQVMTGARIPDGTLGVAMQEDVDAGADRVVLLAPVAPGKHVRSKGEEARSGDVLLPRGTRLDAPAVGALASLGPVRVPTVVPPRVTLVTTGDELVTGGGPLPEGAIYESNSKAIASALATFGGGAVVRHAPDDLGRTIDVLKAAAESSDVLFTCGGVSVGAHDHVREALCALGFTFVVERVSIKPGKPFCLAIRGATVAFCLPGNPMSALVGFELFAVPYLRRWLGLPLARGLVTETREDLGRDPVRHCLVPASLDCPDGKTADPRPVIGSHAVAGLVGADVLLEVPPGPGPLPAGSQVQAVPLSWRMLA